MQEDPLKFASNKWKDSHNSIVNQTFPVETWIVASEGAPESPIKNTMRLPWHLRRALPVVRVSIRKHLVVRLLRSRNQQSAPWETSDCGFRSRHIE